MTSYHSYLYFCLKGPSCEDFAFIWSKRFKYFTKNTFSNTKLYSQRYRTKMLGEEQTASIFQVISLKYIGRI